MYCSDVMPAMPLLSLSVYNCCNSSEELFILKVYTFCMAEVLPLSRKKKSDLLECSSGEQGGLQALYQTLWSENMCICRLQPVYTLLGNSLHHVLEVSSCKK